MFRATETCLAEIETQPHHPHSGKGGAAPLNVPVPPLSPLMQRV